MELDGRVAVITRGTTGIGMGLAIRFMELGATVVIVDSNEKLLVKKATETGAVAIAADMTNRSDIKNLVDKTTRRFGRIDLFISNTSSAALGDHVISQKDWNHYWQSDAMSQMYAAKYVLPQMICRRSGYLINMVPLVGLQAEFRSEMYSTLTHPSLSFSERMLAVYANTGIKVSVICSDCFVLPVDENETINQPDAFKLNNLADQVVRGIRREQFMIFTHVKNRNSYQGELNNHDTQRRMRA